jgi:FtsH-binding integral membrane protein
VLSIAGNKQSHNKLPFQKRDFLTGGAVAVCSAVLCALAALVAYRTVCYYTSLPRLGQSCAVMSLFSSAFFVRFALKPSFIKDGVNIWDGIGFAVSVLSAIFLVYVLPCLTGNFDAIPDLVTVIIALVCAFCGVGLCSLVGVFAFKQMRTGNNKIERR